jgi:peptide/nickel transport system substrate-binding protein
VGASTFAAGHAKSISGIATDDATGQITIHLTAPWGPFENVLAMPATAPVPRSTPLRDEQDRPPAGIGPYEFAGVLPGHSFSLVRDPHWTRVLVPGVPVAHVNIAVKITGNPEVDAVSVLDNKADVFDWSDRIPPSLLPRILREASDRYSRQAINATYLIFMNVRGKPFSSRLARIAVQTGLDDITLKQLGVDTLQEGCFLLPPSMFGHSHDQCPRGNIEKGGDLAAARALVARSGTAGAHVTVWSEARPPFSNWMAYYTGMLNRIGFKARLRLVPPATYYRTIGSLKLHPQTGGVGLGADLPSPVDLYEHLTGPAIRSAGNQNWAEIDDPLINRQVRILGAVPSSNLGAVTEFWHDLESYVADQAYFAVFGYQTAPQFVSDRLEYRRITFSPVAGLDWTSFHLK